MGAALVVFKLLMHVSLPFWLGLARPGAWAKGKQRHEKLWRLGNRVLRKGHRDLPWWEMVEILSKHQAAGKLVAWELVVWHVSPISMEEWNIQLPGGDPWAAIAGHLGLKDSVA